MQRPVPVAVVTSIAPTFGDSLAPAPADGFGCLAALAPSVDKSAPCHRRGYSRRSAPPGRLRVSADD